MRLRLRALFPFAWVVLPVLGACLVEWIRRFAGSGDAAIVTTVSGDANIDLYRELGR